MPRREFTINCNSKLPLARKSAIQEIILLLIPYERNLLIKRLWGTLSKAFSKSIYMQSTPSQLLMFSICLYSIILQVITPYHISYNIYVSTFHTNSYNFIQIHRIYFFVNIRQIALHSTDCGRFRPNRPIIVLTPRKRQLFAMDGLLVQRLMMNSEWTLYETKVWNERSTRSRQFSGVQHASLVMTTDVHLVSPPCCRSWIGTLSSSDMLVAES